MKASFQSYRLNFKRPGGTSRGVLHEKETFFLELKEGNQVGLGECNLFRGLSADDLPEYELKLAEFCDKINDGEEVNWEDWRMFPSIQFGYEQAKLSLNAEDQILIPSDFTAGKKGIQINGLIWMGDADFMKMQIQEKLNAGFHCLKLKIGTNWSAEIDILKTLRQQFSAETLELRVDANGAFDEHSAPDVLEDLARLEVHSIEQPIRQGQWEIMADLCAKTPTPIALDEELIGIFEKNRKEALIKAINPQYIILKPALVGGFLGSEEWIQLAEENQVDWWITSALESNIGLNALAQWTFNLGNPLPQGLGTGGLYTNNTPSRLEIRGEELWFK
ncbi:o-succinylbenzoate synthase [Flavobacteriaceae bacterium Ap0902]|nr:o-succinylbenzoate synthase [Flavobacteriaceae bacterium Ap0902]